MAIICVRYYCDSGIYNLIIYAIIACKCQGQIGIWCSDRQISHQKEICIKGKGGETVLYFNKKH